VMFFQRGLVFHSCSRAGNLPFVPILALSPTVAFSHSLDGIAPPLVPLCHPAAAKMG
jgi:hypothetical protein